MRAKHFMASDGAVDGMATGTVRISTGMLQARVIALWKQVLRFGRRAPRRLRLCESLPLGERRFVAVVEFDASRFLVGGTSSSLVLLSKLADSDRQGAESGSGSEPESRKRAIVPGKPREEPC
jgi:hypothetical protein